MYKSWGFETLADVVLDYKKSYEKWSHQLNKIKVGATIPHEGSSRVSQVRGTPPPCKEKFPPGGKDTSFGHLPGRRGSNVWWRGFR